MSSRLLSDIVDQYTAVRFTDKEKDYIQGLIQQIQKELSSNKKNAKVDCVRQLFYLNLIGSDTSWADFYVLEVMANFEFSAKYISYLTASQIWNSNSDVVLMSTNRIVKDLTSGIPYLTSMVLSSVSSYLTPILAQLMSADVIKLVLSPTPMLQQQSITAFYHICLHYPDALKAGFSNLKACLDSQNQSVVVATLFVMHELCIINPSNFISLIPKFFNLLTTYPQNSFIIIKSVQNLTILSTIEKRLPKKLQDPYYKLLDQTNSMPILYEIIKSIISIPITTSNLLTIALQRMDPLINHSDATIRSLFMQFFMRIISLDPQLLRQNRESVTKCLSSEDENERLLALDLIASMVNKKNLTSIVDKMVENYKTSYTLLSRNQVIAKIIAICSQNDYEFLEDFDWYMDVLFDIFDNGGFSCFEILANQLLDLAVRVPYTRERIVSDLYKVFNTNYMYKDSAPLLLAISHILGNYSQTPKSFDVLLSPFLLQCNERVQLSYIVGAFELFIRIKNESSQNFISRLSVFENSTFTNVKSDLETCRRFILLLNEQETIKDDVRSHLFTNIDKEEEVVEELIPPPDLHDPITIFTEEFDNDIKPKSKKKKGKRAIRKQVNPEAQPKKGKRTKKSRILTRKQSSYGQEIVNNSFLKITATDFIPESNKLTIKLSIENKNDKEIPSIDVQSIDNDWVKIANLPHIQGIDGNAMIQYEFEIEVIKPNIPHILKLLFTPVCYCESGSIETSLKIFPSFFLISVPQSEVDVQTLTISEKIAVEACDATEFAEIISIISSVLRTTEVKTTEDEFMFFSQSTFNLENIEDVNVVGKIDYDDDESIANIEIKSVDQQYTDDLVREIEMRLKNS